MSILLDNDMMNKTCIYWILMIQIFNILKYTCFCDIM